MPSPSEVKISLGGTEYTVPRMTIGQIERLTEKIDALPRPQLDASGQPVGQVSLKDMIRPTIEVLQVGMERAQPPVPDIRAIDASADELMEAAGKIIEVSGFQVAGLQKPDGVPPGAGPAPAS